MLMGVRSLFFFLIIFLLFIQDINVVLDIVPDPQKFPSGMKALADYVHSKELKLGM